MPIQYPPELSYSHHQPHLSYHDLNNQQHFCSLSASQQQQLAATDHAIRAAEEALQRARATQNELLQQWVNQDYAAYRQDCRQTPQGQDTLDTMDATVSLQNFADRLTRSTGLLFELNAPLSPFIHFLSHSLRVTGYSYEITGTWRGQQWNEAFPQPFALAQESLRTQIAGHIAHVWRPLLPQTTMTHKLQVWDMENSLEGVVHITWVWPHSPHHPLSLSIAVAEWIQAIQQVYQDEIPEFRDAQPLLR